MKSTGTKPDATDDLDYDAAMAAEFDAEVPLPPESKPAWDGKSKPIDLPSIAYVHGQTDSAHASRFIDAYHRELLYVPPWRKWLSWDGSRWHDDNGVGVLQRAKRYGCNLWQDLAKIAPLVDRDELGKIVTAIKAVNQTPRIKSFLELAAVDERVVCGVAELNADPTLLNVANGTIDLTTGKLRPHNPADRITQLANVVYDPNALCPEWERTLDLIFGGDTELIRYVQRLLGYSISGDTGEHILPIACGKGCNGKSTVWNVVTELLGDYAALANDELLMGESAAHPTDKASLYQKRFVAISEPERNSSLREARVKELTGDRKVTCRRMREDFWTFDRTHTFWLSTNHLPRIDGTDDGIWRRVKLIPFTVDLRTKVTPITDFDQWLLKNEGPGILGWLVRGYLDYRQHGLVEPRCVKDATGKYRADSDPLGNFLAEFCEVDAGAVTTAKELFRVYSEIHKGAWGQTRFGLEMAERFEKARPTDGEYRKQTIYRGLRLRANVANSPTPENHETQEKQGLPIVAHSSTVSPRDLPNPIDEPNNCGQPWANTSDDCNHDWLDSHESDGRTRRFCRTCIKFAGFVLADGSTTFELPQGARQ